MTDRAKKNILIVVLIVLTTALWVWYDLRTKPANERIQAGVQKLLQQDSRLRPLYDEAMTDGVFSTLDADTIIDRAKQLKGE